ncbi:glucose-6-phosphate isomerase [soil metagenome]
MGSLSLSSQHALVDTSRLKMDLVALAPLFKTFEDQEGQKGYSSPYSFINLPIDRGYIAQVKKLVAAKQNMQPALAVVVGIGGSNLGTQAVYQALYSWREPSLPLYFADTVDPEAMAFILGKADRALAAGKNLLIIAISKSGSTTETIANFECLLELLIKYQPDSYAQSVIAITDKDSPFWKLAITKQYELLEIPAHIGGRFSVLSAVGLFPLALAGVDIDALCKGAQEMSNSCIAQAEDNPAFILASTLAFHYAKGIAIHDLFLFCGALEGLGKWQRQLLAESLGKPNQQGKPQGITPTVSVGSTDLHSMGQLYLGGPVARVTTFVWVDDAGAHVYVPEMPEFNNLVPHLQNKSLHMIMEAIFNGTQKAYEQAKCPFMTMMMPEKNAFYIGQFLQMQMIATSYLGALLNVNTFDQPQVELYKRNTRKILADE